MAFYYLKPCQNKKNQSFVVMLGICMSFFEFASPACCKKRHAKPSIKTNVWSFLFCQSFSILSKDYVELALKLMRLHTHVQLRVCETPYHLGVSQVYLCFMIEIGQEIIQA
jgi:hypothetical protein